MERRRLYLTSRITSLLGYCMQELGYDEDAALKRHRVTKLALRFPQVLDELRAGTMHLTGLFLLAKHLREDNASALLAEARGKSRRELEMLIAQWFPRPDVAARLEPVGLTLTTSDSSVGPANPTCSRSGDFARSRLEPLSPSRWRVEGVVHVRAGPCCHSFNSIAAPTSISCRCSQRSPFFVAI